jgi:cold shock CspA family protein
MEQPLEVAFHGMDSSDALHAHIRKEAEKLERFGKAVTSARVSVERAQRHGTTDVDEVHIDVHARGKHLFAKETVEHRHRGHGAGPYDIYNAVSRAMDQAVRQIDSQLAKRSDKQMLQAHEGASNGRIARLDPERRFGFVERAEGPDLFFHEAVLKDASFDELHEGDAVRFAVAEAEGAYGPQARYVEPVSPGK